MTQHAFSRSAAPAPRDNVGELLAAAGLSRMERRLCDLLVLHFGKFLPTERLTGTLWWDDADGGPENAENTLSVMVHNIRKKLEPVGLVIASHNGSGRKMIWSNRTLPGSPASGAPDAAAQGNVAVLPSRRPDTSSLRDGDIDLGQADTGGTVGLSLARLMEGRLLVQGASGAGKSWTLRRILEQTAGRIQQVVIDPEGEFRSLAERFDLLVLDGHMLDDAALRQVAERARARRISLVLDLSDCEREDQMQAAATFFSALVEAPREDWHPCLVAVDEAHLFAPFGGDMIAAPAIRRAAIGALVSLMSRGRKRGLVGILATQRLARLSKSVVSEALNFLVGLNTLDLDIRRAAETIGWDSRRAFDRLPMLAPGDFVAVGPAFSRSPAVLRVGQVETEHRGATPGLTGGEGPEVLAPGEAAIALGLDALMAASVADQQIRDENALAPGLKAVRSFVRDAAALPALKIFAELKPLFPEGARVADIRSALDLDDSQVSSALVLLDQLGFLDFTGEGGDRIVRIGPVQAHVLGLPR